MLRNGMQIAEAGTYWNIRTGERIMIQYQDVLPGDATTRYLRASSTTMLFLGPIVGLTFAIFLPFIGIAMAASFAGKKIAQAGKQAVQGMVEAGIKNIFFFWRPLQAYLAKKRQAEKGLQDRGKTEQKK